MCIRRPKIEVPRQTKQAAGVLSAVWLEQDCGAQTVMDLSIATASASCSTGGKVMTSSA
eukprot:CAMPEP_0195048100 /NCGR_PEP_ID=MMETSP0347-20130606/43072_1 /TAXON_ID=2932 /ORGANISM="Alexandrium fundyense, Strain CCMP1719" /LENGTH=58 /DNA_ID=CAMNT_0040076501 /DNA_START=42 /DNA_END=215 /DNA_ORIENTATION=-